MLIHGPLLPDLPNAGALQLGVASPVGQAGPVSRGSWAVPTWRLLALPAGWVTRSLQGLVSPCLSHPWELGNEVKP